MKLSIITILTGLLTSSTVFADEIPLSTSSALQNQWTGFYAGMNVGRGQADATMEFSGAGWWDFFGVGGVTNFDAGGASFGLQAGYNHQFSNNIVAGIEASYNTSSISQTIPSQFFPALDTFNVEVKNYWTVAGRLGYVMNKALVYGSAGFAGASVSSTAFDVTRSDTSVVDHTGVVMGVGFEYMVNPTLIFGLDYKHMDLGSKTHLSNLSTCGVCSVGDNRNVNVTVDTLSATVKFKF